MKEKNKDKGKNKDKLYYGIIIVVAIITICTIVATMIVKGNKPENDIPYTELIKKISNQEVEEIEMTTGSNSIIDNDLL